MAARSGGNPRTSPRVRRFGTAVRKQRAVIRLHVFIGNASSAELSRRNVCVLPPMRSGNGCLTRRRPRTESDGASIVARPRARGGGEADDDSAVMHLTKV